MVRDNSVATEVSELNNVEYERKNKNTEKKRSIPGTMKHNRDITIISARYKASSEKACKLQLTAKVSVRN